MAQKKGKYAFWEGTDKSNRRAADPRIQELRTDLISTYRNKYYNLWMSHFVWNGLDEELKDKQENYIMRKLWAEGTVACRQTKIGLLAFAPWVQQEIDMYDTPETVNLVNEHGVSTAILPETPQVVNKDVVLIYAQPNLKPIKRIVNSYIERMVNVEMAINTNLNLHKMPWLIAVDEGDRDKMKDRVERILRDEIVVYADLAALQKLQTFATATPYIIDKLTQHKRDIEHELLTYLGIDNNGTCSLEQTHIVSDAINANNDMINDYGAAIESTIKKGIERVNKLFNRNISIETRTKPVTGGTQNDVEQNDN